MFKDLSYSVCFVFKVSKEISTSFSSHQALRRASAAAHSVAERRVAALKLVGHRASCSVPAGGNPPTQ